jgi:hypothetical protein
MEEIKERKKRKAKKFFVLIKYKSKNIFKMNTFQGLKFISNVSKLIWFKDYFL